MDIKGFAAKLRWKAGEQRGEHVVVAKAAGAMLCAMVKPCEATSH